jgi:hypothetical protein
LAGEFGLRVGLTTLAFLALTAAVIARISDSGHDRERLAEGGNGP